MRTLTIAALAACLLASPAHAQLERLHPVTGLELAQGTTIAGDMRRCEALAAKMDKAKPPSKEDNAALDDCVKLFNCDEVREIPDDKVPAAAVASNKAMLQFIFEKCGILEQLTPGERFMREKP